MSASATRARRRCSTFRSPSARRADRRDRPQRRRQEHDVQGHLRTGQPQRHRRGQRSALPRSHRPHGPRLHPAAQRQRSQLPDHRRRTRAGRSSPVPALGGNDRRRRPAPGHRRRWPGRLDERRSRRSTQLSGGQLQRAPTWPERWLSRRRSCCSTRPSAASTSRRRPSCSTCSRRSPPKDTTLLVATHDLALRPPPFQTVPGRQRHARGDGPPGQVLSADVLDATFGSAGNRALAD